MCLIAEFSIMINLFNRTGETIGKSKPHPLIHYRPYRKITLGHSAMKSHSETKPQRLNLPKIKVKIRTEYFAVLKCGYFQNNLQREAECYSILKKCESSLSTQFTWTVTDGTGSPGSQQLTSGAQLGSNAPFLVHTMHQGVYQQNHPQLYPAPLLPNKDTKRKASRTYLLLQPETHALQIACLGPGVNGMGQMIDNKHNSAPDEVLLQQHHHLQAPAGPLPEADQNLVT